MLRLFSYIINLLPKITPAVVTAFGCRIVIVFTFATIVDAFIRGGKSLQESGEGQCLHLLYFWY